MSRNIGTNAVSISVVMLPLYPGGAVEDFAAESDVWTGDAYETADAFLTPDGNTYKYGKNAMIARTLTLAPLSPLRQFLDLALTAQVRYGAAVAEPFSVTVVVTHQHSNQVDVYTDGIISGGNVGGSYGQDKMNNAAYTFKFGRVVVKSGR